MSERADTLTSEARPWFGAALCGLVLAELAMLAALPFFVTPDGAGHIGTSSALIDALLGRTTLWRDYATVEWFPFTNLIPDLALGAFSEFMPPEVAERVVVGIYVVSLPFAALYAVAGVDRRRWWLAFLAVPLTFTYVLNYGFYPFCFGVIGFLLVVGYVVRHREHMTAGHAARLAGLFALTYVAHPLPFAQALAFALIVLGWDWLLASGTDRGRVSRQLAFVLIAALPEIAIGGFLVLGSLGESSAATLRSPLTTLPATLSLVWGIVTFDIREAVFTIAIALALAAMVVMVLLRRRSEGPTVTGRMRWLRPADAFLAFAVIVLAEVVLLPEGSNLGGGGGFLGQRLAVLPVYGIALWLAAVPWSARIATALVLTAAASAVGLGLVRWPVYAELSRLVERYVATAACIAPESTMIQANLVILTPAPFPRTAPLTAETGRVSALTDGWDLGNVQVSLPFFPLRARPETDPYRHMPFEGTAIEAVPPTLDPLGYERRTGGRVDYVLVYGRSEADPSTLASEGWTRLNAQLHGAFSIVARSADGLLEVHERTGSAAALAGAARRAVADPGVCVSG